MGNPRNLSEDIIECNSRIIKDLHLKHLLVLLKMTQEISNCYLEEYGLKVAPLQEQWIKERLKRVERLKRMGLKATDNNMSFYLNYLSPACHYCKKGFGPTLSPTLRCNRNCFYCFVDKSQNQENDIYGNAENNAEVMVNWLKDIRCPENILNLGISGGEPLLALDTVLRMINTVKNRRKIKALTRLYTNGDLLDENVLKKLKNAGLDEIRFGLKYGDFNILKKVILAKKHIPRVMMEGPVFPESENYLKKLLSELDKIKIFGINLLELDCSTNFHLFKRRGYMYSYKDKLPFYELWQNPHQWPIYGCEKVIFDLLEFSIKKCFSLSVHYCSVKQMLHRQSKRRQLLAALERQRHETITDKGLLRKLLIYYPNYLKAKRDLEKHNVSDREIKILPGNKGLETHTRNLKYLNLNKYEVGVLDTLSNGEKASVTVIRSKNFHSLSTGNKAVFAGNALPLAWLRRIISQILLRTRAGEANRITKRVLDILREKLEIIPNSPTIYYNLSLLYYHLKQYKKAIKAANKAMELKYKEGEMRFLLGSAYERTKQYQKAIEQFKEAEKINPKDVRIISSLVNCYKNTGQKA